MAFRMLSASRRIGRGGLNFSLSLRALMTTAIIHRALSNFRDYLARTICFSLPETMEIPSRDFLSTHISHDRSLTRNSRLLTQSWHPSNALTRHILSFTATRDSFFLWRDFDFWQRKAPRNRERCVNAEETWLHCRITWSRFSRQIRRYASFAVCDLRNRARARILLYMYIYIYAEYINNAYEYF